MFSIHPCASPELPPASSRVLSLCPASLIGTQPSASDSLLLVWISLEVPCTCAHSHGVGITPHISHIFIMPKAQLVSVVGSEYTWNSADL